MKFRERKLRGLIEVCPEPISDNRGYFMTIYNKKLFEEKGIYGPWVLENQSLSKKRGVIRGLHFQLPPHNQAKLIRVLKGEILDVVIDLRKDSGTFAQWDGMVLSGDNKKMLFVPKGFAHGFCTLAEGCEVMYKADSYYRPESEGAIKWNDPDIGIEWPVKDPILSEKDSKAGSFRSFVNEYGSLDV